MFWKKKQKVANKPTRAEIIAQAKKNAKAASEAIGEDTLARIRAHIENNENSEFHQALRRIKAMDKDRVADNIRATYRDE